MNIDPTVREQVARDPHRPQYHFVPPANWMNDPNGLIQWQGQYHLFYQYNPHGPFWGTIHWGHAMSPDLVHWQHLPIALSPTPGAADEDGCWSGCAVDDNGVPTLIYSGARNGVQRTCLATSTDNLLTWEKHLGNPVIPDPPNLDLVAYRDHCVWREDGTWYQVIGAGINGVGGTVLLYRSYDLRRWEYLHPLLIGDVQQQEPLWSGSMWECPSFFPLGDKHVLLVSVWDKERLHYTAYFVGTYADHRFFPERVGKFDFGDHHFYAPQTMLDDQGRRIVFGWIQEARSVEAQKRAGWSGVMSLPREVSLRSDGTLHVAPVRELQQLRGAHDRWTDLPIDQTPALLPNIRGDALEIIAEIDPGDAAEVGIKVRAAVDGSEETIIAYDRINNRLLINRQRASLAHDTQQHEQGGLLVLAVDEPLRLHVFIDRSVIEVFANGCVCLTSRVYPRHPESLGVGVFASSGTAQLRVLDMWSMRSIWD